MAQQGTSKGDGADTDSAAGGGGVGPGRSNGHGLGPDLDFDNAGGLSEDFADSANTTPEEQFDAWRAAIPTTDQIAAEPNVIFDPPVLRALVGIKQHSHKTYLDITSPLIVAAKSPDVTRKKLDDAVKTETGKLAKEEKAAAALAGDADGGDKENVVNALIRLGKQGTELFHAPDGQAYATVLAEGHPQTMRVKGNTFLEILLNRHMDETGRGVTGEALQNAAMNLAALARRKNAPKYAVFPRIGMQNGNIYVDRGSDQFDAYEIRPAKKLANGSFRPEWSLIAQPPVKFVRPEGAPVGELPIAKTASDRELEGDEDIEDLREFLAVPDDAAFILAVGWVLGAFVVEGDKAIAALSGEGGSGKTSTARFLCALVDPLPPSPDAGGSGDRRGHLRAPTSDPWDLSLAAQTTLVQPFDNISEIDAALADLFCRISTGGGVRRRSFYGLLDETVLSARRPIILTAVEDLTVRGDLASRTLFIRAGRKPGVEAADEVRLWQAFEVKWPALLGVIFDAVSVGLANQLPDMADPPRLAYFANWVCRCEIGLGWAPGTFMAAYRANQTEGAAVVADADPVISAVRDFVETETAQGHSQWEGTPTELYKKLEVTAGDLSRRGRAWPKRPAELSKRLCNVVSTLARLGITVTLGARTSRAAQITLSWPAAPTHAHVPSTDPNDEKVPTLPALPTSKQINDGNARVSGGRCDVGDSGEGVGSAAAATTSVATETTNVGIAGTSTSAPTSERSGASPEEPKENGSDVSTVGNVGSNGVKRAEPRGAAQCASRGSVVTRI
jgi:hypothetical protein